MKRIKARAVEPGMTVWCRADVGTNSAGKRIWSLEQGGQVTNVERHKAVNIFGEPRSPEVVLTFVGESRRLTVPEYESLVLG